MMIKELKFETGTLWQKILDRTERALKNSALFPISTETMFIKDSGIDFQVRMVSNLARKAEEKREIVESGGRPQKKQNPFLPYEEDLFVADVSDTHVCLLNKFNVIDHHLLVVTRDFEDQESLLTLRDFEAIWACMAEFDGLAFYNGGKVAGASQPHKHLQMIPLPLVENGPKVPIEPILASVRLERDLNIVQGIPFVHSFARFPLGLKEHASKAAEVTFPLYRQMLQATGLNRSGGPEGAKQSGPYNLLFTREWMLLVPRSEEFFGSISINALGFAGALLVLNDKQMQMINQSGCMTALKHVTVAV